MLFAEFLVAAVFTIVFVGIFALAFGVRGPWPGLGWLFLVVLLGTWAIGVWTAPVGPVLYGVNWVPFLFGAFLLVLLFASIPAPPPPPAEGDPVVTASAAALGLFFWALLLFLLVVILVSLVGAA